MWPYPFGAAPPSVLPADYLGEANHRHAATVDYVIVSREEAAAVPSGFVPDGGGERYLRFRRDTSTTAHPVTCGKGAGS
jgi:hypothetical protein